VRKYYEASSYDTKQKYSETYECDHILYNRCTLFRLGDRGLAVIQQRFNPKHKMTWWSSIDPWLANDIFENPNFAAYLEENARKPDEKGLYDTVPVRQLMWKIGMDPMRKEFWETKF